MPSTTKHRHLLNGAVLAAVPVLAGLAGINSMALVRGDEKFYLHMAQVMLDSGNWLVPTYFGDFNLAKPPFYYWLVALCYKLFGLHLFAARIPSLLAAGGTCALTYWFAFRLYNDARGAALAALALASSYTFYVYSKLAMTDMWMTLGIVSASFFFLRGVLEGKRRWNFFLASLGIGLAGLAKGHVGAVLGSLPILAFLAADSRSKDRVPVNEWLGPWAWFPAGVLCFWWYVFLLTSNAPAGEFAWNHPRPQQPLHSAFHDYFSQEEGNRTSGGLQGLGKNLTKYPVYFLRITFPWSLCVLAGFFFGHKRLRQDWKTHRRETLMLLAMILPLFLLFTLVILQQARSRYLLPAAPAVSILAGRFLSLRQMAKGKSAGLAWPGTLAAALLVVYNMAFIWIGPAVRGNAFQSLCEGVRPGLPQDCEIWVATAKTKYPAYVSVLLARRVKYFRIRSDGRGGLAVPQDLIEATRKLRVKAGPVFLFTNRDAWELVPLDARNRFKLVGEDRELRRKVKVRDVLKVLQKQGLAEIDEANLFRVLLLRSVPSSPSASRRGAGRQG